MVGEHIAKSAERAWKHRFAQILYEIFCTGGLEKAAALDDAYAHADAQYLVRGLGSPEDEALTALTWIQADAAAASTDSAYAGAPGANPHNGAHHVETTPYELAAMGLPE